MSMQGDARGKGEWDRHMVDQQTLSKLCKLGQAGQPSVADPYLHLPLRRSLLCS